MLKLTTAKNHRIYHIINEFSEALSLSNDPQQLLETALDTTTEILGVSCCWIQLGSLESHLLPLVACRGFTPAMQSEISLGTLEHDLVSRVAGLGHKIIIPDLNRDEEYDLSAFRAAGLESLAAVPVRTYRIHGIMGVATRSQQRFNRDFPELLMAVAGLVGMALNKAIIARNGTIRVKEISANRHGDIGLPEQGEKEQSTAESEKMPTGNQVTHTGMQNHKVTAGATAAAATMLQEARQESPQPTGEARNSDKTFYELTKPASLPVPPPVSQPISVVKPTRESADALSEFARIWGSLPQGEVIVIERTDKETNKKGKEDYIVKLPPSVTVPESGTSESERLAEEPATRQPPARNREPGDVLAEHCRKMRRFRMSHAASHQLAS